MSDNDNTMHEDDAPVEKVAFRFCQECSNMLYPSENTEDKCLMFVCRSCKWAQPAPGSCIYRREVGSTKGDTAGITQFVGEDPTLPRITKTCPSCHEQEAVFFQSQQRTADTGMKLYFVCCSCSNVWQ